MRPLLRAGDVQIPAIVPMSSSLATPSAPLVQRDRSAQGNVQRLGGRRERDRRGCVAARNHVVGKTFALGAENERGSFAQLQFSKRGPAVRDERDPWFRAVLEETERYSEDRTRRCSHGLRARGVRGAGGEGHERRTESVRRPE